MQEGTCNDGHLRPDWVGEGWYRVGGGAGQRIVEHPVSPMHCGTAATGWLSGGHPNVSEGMVSRSVCFNTGSESCAWHLSVEVLNCKFLNINIFFYLLPDVPTCYLGFCTE